jgi:uncharacterized protein with von Willebrand factor type A (vWA) domain
LIGLLADFVEELRSVGVPVSMVEALDAAAALSHADLGNPEALRSALSATLVKNERHQEAFTVAFDVFFGLRGRPDAGPGESEQGDQAPQGGAGAGAGGGAGGDDDANALFEAIAAALESGDREALHRLARLAVDRFGGIEPGRPVGGRYYFYRVMRRINADALLERLLGEPESSDPADSLDARIALEAAQDRIEELRAEVRREIVRRLVEDRGAASVAKTLRSPLVEDIDLMHATREELARIERTVAPLARKLATRLAQRRKLGRKGRLDVRRTIRRSLAHGGTLLEPHFKPPRKSKPELVLLCDVSGSMATFARFTMQLTYAIGNQFSKVRSFAFIDGIDEVTDFFGSGTDFHDGLTRMGAEAQLVWRDGHSDYGNALRRFEEDFADAVTARSTLIVTGDARNNYRDSRADVLSALRARARALFWLNPEARRYWNTGDSIMSAYASRCDGVYEVRTLRQLERFVEQVAIPTAPLPKLHAEVS